MQDLNYDVTLSCEKKKKESFLNINFIYHDEETRLKFHLISRKNIILKFINIVHLLLKELLKKKIEN